MKRFNRILWGVVLVALGIIFGLNALGVASINIFFDGWWTLFIIVPSIISLFTEREKMGSLIFLLAGVLLLLGAQGVLSYDTVWKLIIPIAVILFGLTLIFKEGMDQKSRDAMHAAEKLGGARGHCTAAFSEQTLDSSGMPFEGAALTAVFGAVKCDLQNALLSHDVVIDVCSVFGGIDILLPPHVNVKVATTAVFGGSSDRHTGQPANAITVYVRGTCIFGGVTIK